MQPEEIAVAIENHKERISVLEREMKSIKSLAESVHTMAVDLGKMVDELTRQRDTLDAQQGTLDDLDTRTRRLEAAPGEAALKSKNAIKAAIISAIISCLVGTGIGAIITYFFGG